MSEASGISWLRLGAALALASALAGSPIRAQVSVPNEFMSGMTAVAQDVNDNFEELVEEANDVRDRLDDVEDDVGDLETSVSGLEDDVGVLQDEQAGVEFNTPSSATIDVETQAMGLTSLGSIVVSAPVSGFLVVRLEGVVRLGEDTLLNYGIGLDDDTAYEGGFSGEVGILVVSSGTIDDSTHSFSTTRVFPVSAGNVTLHGLANKVEVLPGSLARVSDVRLTALFVPNRY